MNDIYLFYIIFVVLGFIYGVIFAMFPDKCEEHPNNIMDCILILIFFGILLYALPKYFLELFFGQLPFRLLIFYFIAMSFGAACFFIINNKLKNQQ
jgi:hypothetical protein